MNSVIATTPAGMLAAQTQMQAWIGDKLADAKRDLSTAESVFNSLQSAKLRTAKASTQIRKARVRIVFYEKMAAALAAGYYIIPPFDVQVFAIRTNRHQHSSDWGSTKWAQEEKAIALPLGVGRYVDPVNTRSVVDTEQRERDGKTTDIAIYDNDADWKDVELPIRALKPTIIEATRAALGALIFDALAIAPAYRNPDPLIVGQIKHYKSYTKPVTFFVAWWMDEADL